MANGEISPEFFSYDSVCSKLQWTHVRRVFPFSVFTTMRNENSHINVGGASFSDDICRARVRNVQ